MEKERYIILANEFSRLLRKELTAEDLTEINRRNNEQKNSNICHSHDFIDANMTMYEAQDNLRAANIHTDSNDVNRAWNYAKFNQFKSNRS